MSKSADAGLRILLVEDEPANRALIRAILARAREAALEGYVLLEAGTIAEARAILASEPLDVVLLDVRLPDGTGLDLAAEIRASQTATARIVIVSASVLPAERSRAIESGADAFLGKPFGAVELVETLTALRPAGAWSRPRRE
ncbi:MAG: response regulator [Chloroflexota bacterium]|nr:MAG: response regulator [Chloroflexota bacterium]